MIENYEVVPMLVMYAWLAFFMLGMHIQITVIDKDV